MSTDVLDPLQTLMKDYWDAVDARQYEQADEIMRKIGAESLKRGVGMTKPFRRDRYLGGRSVRW